MIKLKNLRKLRKEKNISMKKLGEDINVAESTISLYETGKREPDYETLKKIAEYFDVSIDYLLGRVDVRKDTTSAPADKEFVAFYEGYKDLDDADKEILKATLDAFVRAKKGDK